MRQSVVAVSDEAENKLYRWTPIFVDVKAYRRRTLAPVEIFFTKIFGSRTNLADVAG